MFTLVCAKCGKEVKDITIEQFIYGRCGLCLHCFAEYLKMHMDAGKKKEGK